MSLAAFLMAAALLPMGAAGATEPRVGPPLEVFASVDEDGTTATMYVSGRGCLPQDAPASVMVTVDRFPDKVFTATPNEAGRWSVDFTVPYPIDGVYVINAECDNYFGTTVYPEFAASSDNIVIAIPTTVVPHPPIAATGSRTANEVGIGVGGLVAGMLLVWLGRPRGATQKVWRK